PAMSAVVSALSCSALRRCLPRRLRRPSPQETLGYARASLLWLTMLVPVLVGTVAQAVLSPAPAPVEAGARTRAADDVCRDRAGLEAFGKPLPAAEAAIAHATTQTIVAAVEGRIQAATSAAQGLEGYEPHG